MVIIMYLIIT